MTIEDDKLSAAAREILSLNPSGAYDQLVVRGTANPDAHRLLKSLGPQDLLARPARDPELARALLAGLWLWHDGLEASHRISQGIGSATGSYWHAIMHRREGDFSNAKYWYARCREHPALADLASAASAAGLDPSVQSSRLVDWVEAAVDGAQESPVGTAVQFQKLEWQTLFNWCLRHAAEP